MKKKCSKLSKIIIAVVAVAIVVIGASVFSLRPKGELLEYTGKLTGSSLYNNWEFGGKTLDITGQEVVWQEKNPKRVPLVFKTEPNKDDFGKIIRVWGRINYYTPKDKREMTPKDAPYLKVERYEVLSRVKIYDFMEKEIKQYIGKMDCKEKWSWGGGSWLLSEANELELKASARKWPKYVPNGEDLRIYLWFNGKTGGLIKEENNLNGADPCE